MIDQGINAKQRIVQLEHVSYPVSNIMFVIELFNIQATIVLFQSTENTGESFGSRRSLC